MKEYLELGKIEELESKGVTGDEAISVLEKDFFTLLEESRELLAVAQDAEDEVTADLVIGIMAEYEKSLWMIKSYKA